VVTEPVVAAYERISDAYDEGTVSGLTTAGVERQAQANGHIAQARGWRIGQHYTDNSVSAFKANVRREAFEQMLADLDAGLIEGIVCYNLDRFARRPDDLERAIAIYDRARKAGRRLLFASAEGDLDLSSDDGLTMARVMISFANKASRDTGRRVAAKRQATRDTGRVVSGRRPFGWDVKEDGTRVLNEAETLMIRWAAEALTSGKTSWREVARTWNEHGLLTPVTKRAGGRPWQPVTVKQVMRSPRLAGWLVHDDKIATHSQTGELLRADAPPILTDDEYEALLAATTADGGGFTSASNRRKYLLAGLVRCSECGSRLVGNAQPEGRFVYKCGEASCGKVTCSGRGLDQHVSSLVLPRIVRESKRFRVIDIPPHGAELVELEEERADLLADMREERLAADVGMARLAPIDRRLEEIRRVRTMHVTAQRQLNGQVITAKSWQALSLDEQRRHIERHLECVYLSPRLRNTGRKFDTARVSDPVWKSMS
jgi:DNA invertase Pin-like site-specific DNA recombinase